MQVPLISGSNKTWIEADIPCINVTNDRYNALVPAIVYVRNDVTIPFNSMTSQSQHNEPCCERTWKGPNRFVMDRFDDWTQLYFFMYKG